ncbi:MAG: MarR family transcriptional regulator [Roseburia sp.]|nr:MarR family transcriptional regulator [Roseburia sp.]
MGYTLHYLLMADHAMVQKKFFAEIKDMGLSMGQPKVLDYLKDKDGAVQKDIAKGCHIEPASLSTILAGMEKNGLIIRRTQEDNRRNLKVYMTDRGRELCAEITKKFAEIEKAALADFSMEEAEKLQSYLIKIYKNMEV